jgi:hypothetical protein
MPTAKEIMDDALFRAKNMQEYIVERELPGGFQFYGVVPFDILIQDGKVKASVLAVSSEEAERMVSKFFDDGMAA